MAVRLLATSLALLAFCGLVACGSDSGDPARDEAKTVQGAGNSGDTSIHRFGVDVTGVEREKAVAALSGFLDARAAGAWAGACDHLANAVALTLVRQLGPDRSRGASCEEVLADLYKGVPEEVLRASASADVDAFRARGQRGFLLFHGTEADYFMPLQRQGGAWKVAAVSPSALP